MSDSRSIEDRFPQFAGEPTAKITTCCACGAEKGDDLVWVELGWFCDEREGKGWVAGFRCANSTHEALAARESPWQAHSRMLREIALEEDARRRALPWYRRILP